MWKQKEGIYAKSLAKIQFTAIFLKQYKRKNVLLKFIDLYGDAI